VRISSSLEIILESISNYEYDYLCCIGGMVSLYVAMVTGHNSDSYHAKQYAPPVGNSISSRLSFLLLIY
jgi:hypothetical protein